MTIDAKRTLFATLFAVAICTSSPSKAMEVSGPAAIVDGDTLWVGSQEIRIHGIDAPETNQKCQLPKARLLQASRFN